MSRTSQPATIGPYRILQLLGDGGMGDVYLAEQREPVRRRVALKVIKLGMDTKQVIARFDAERQALAMMEHPNIAKVFDAGASAEGRAYFTMEYVNGLPLSQYCDKHKLSVRERVGLLLQVCRGVHHAHQKGVIHRDLKPQNILVKLVEGLPVAKIIDFGIAKATAQRLTEHTYFTEQGQIIGTPEYMSPEQAEMTALDVDHRSDLYSLGVLLYELVTGALPFDPVALRKSGLFEIRRIIVDVDPPPMATRLTQLGDRAPRVAELRQSTVRELTHALRGGLERVVCQAMAKNPNRRYESAQHLALDLERWLDKQPVLARPVGFVRRTLRSFRSWRVWAPAAAVLVAVIAGFLAIRSGAPPAAGIAPMFSRAWQGEPGQRAEFGRSLGSLGDVNADGHPDVVVGSPFFVTPGAAAKELDFGRVEVYSGRDGEILHTWQGSELPFERFGNAIAGGGDLNGDGRPDVVVGAWGHAHKTGAVYVYSSGGIKLWEKAGDAREDFFGKSVAIVGDLDGDGCDDVAVGAPQRAPGTTGYVRVFAGRTGERIGEIRGEQANGMFGHAVAGAGDLDGDGSIEILIGACYESGRERNEPRRGVGAVYVFGFDGKRFVRKARKSGDEGEGRFGWCVSPAGDYDGDGRPDFMASGCMSELGVVRVYSGGSYELLATLRGEKPGHEFGRSIARLGDLDGDGCEDLAIGTHPPRPHAGYVVVIAGGRVRSRIFGGQHGDQFGLVLSDAGDLDRDGVTDLIIGAPGFGGTGAAFPVSGRQILENSRLELR